MQVQKAKQGYKLENWHYNKKLEIPEDWNYEQLKSNIQILSGFSFKSEFFDNEKGVPLIRIRDLPNNTTDVRYKGEYDDDFLVHKGDLLVGMDGEFRPYLWRGNDALLNQRVCKVTTKNDNELNQKFLFYSIGKELLYYELKNVGTTVIHISKTDIEKISLPFPPIKEQQKIASILSNVDSLINQTQKEIEQTQRLKKGLMQQLLTKGISHSDFKKQKFCFSFLKDNFPTTWKIVQIKEISNIVRGSSPRPAGDPRYFGGPIPWITVGDLTKNDFMFLNSTKSGLTEEGRKHSRVLEKGTVVISNSGYTLGHPKILNITGCANDGIAAFIEIRETVDPKFLYYSLKQWTKHLRNVNQGVFQVNLNTEILGNLFLPLPELKEQQEIASILSNIDSKIQQQKDYKFKLVTLKKGLMQKLLTGQIRV